MSRPNVNYHWAKDSMVFFQQLFIKITNRYININGEVFEYRISDKDEFA
jgi:hypothetical protein